jgi:hypothetical protein
MNTTLTPAQQTGLAYYAAIELRKTDKTVPHVKFSHSPRVQAALIELGYIERLNDGLPGVGYKITESGMRAYSPRLLARVMNKEEIT